VIITCGAKHPYGTGKYVQASNTIESANKYKIRIIEGDPRQIVFEAEGGQIAGSWTAKTPDPGPATTELEASSLHLLGRPGERQPAAQKFFGTNAPRLTLRHAGRNEADRKSIGRSRN